MPSVWKHSSSRPSATISQPTISGINVASEGQVAWWPAITRSLPSIPGAALVFALVLSAAVQHATGFLHARHAALVAVVIGCAVGYRQRARLRHGRFTVPVAAVFIGSIVFAIGVAMPDQLRGWAAARNVTCAILGWSAAALLIHDERSSTSQRPELLPIGVWPLLGCILIVGTALGVWWHLQFEGHFARIIDENLYVLQSRLFGQPGFGLPIAPGEEKFFNLRQAAITGGRLRTQYPPGWPLVLAGFHAIGLREWSSVIGQQLAVLSTFLVGRYVYSARAGLIAAALLATSPWAVQLSGTYFAHSVTAACVVTAAWLTLRGERAQRVERMLGWIAAGTLLGFAIAIRPLTGAALASSVFLWLAIRGEVGLKPLVMAAGAMFVGAVPVLTMLAGFNALTTGSPLSFGYTAINGQLHALGFGVRGMIDYDVLGQAHAIGKPFGLTIALQHASERAWELCDEVLIPFLAVPLIWVAARSGFRTRWGVIAIFALLPLAHFFYFYSEQRFNSELLPFALVGLAGAVTSIRSRVMSARALALTLTAAGLTITLIQSVQYKRSFWDAFRAYDRVEEATARYGRVLVFVGADSARPVPSYPGENSALLEQLYWYNTEFPHGKVIVARDLGAQNEFLVRRYPQYAPLRLRYDSKARVITLVPLQLLAGEPRAQTGDVAALELAVDWKGKQ